MQLGSFYTCLEIFNCLRREMITKPQLSLEFAVNNSNFYVTRTFPKGRKTVWLPWRHSVGAPLPSPSFRVKSVSPRIQFAQNTCYALCVPIGSCECSNFSSLCNSDDEHIKSFTDHRQAVVSTVPCTHAPVSVPGWCYGK